MRPSTTVIIRLPNDFWLRVKDTVEEQLCAWQKLALGQDKVAQPLGSELEPKPSVCG